MAGVSFCSAAFYSSGLCFRSLNPEIKATAERLLSSVKTEDQKLVGEQSFERVKILRLRDVEVLTPVLAQAIAYLLRQNAEIDSISLHGKKVSSELVEPIAEALKSNHRLKTLNLDVNHLGSSGALYIAEAIKVNHTLEKLCLHGPLPELMVGGSFYYHPIGDEGVSLLAEALKVNRGIKHLRLSNSNMTNVGALRLLAAVRVNSSLEHVNLDLSYGVDSKIIADIQRHISKSQPLND